MSGSVLTSSQLATFDFGRACGMKTHSSEAMARTIEDVRKVQGEALIIGGLALIHHGYERYTKDIDLLYAYLDGSILKRLAPLFKLVRKAENGWHHLEHRETGIRLELIPEGGLTTYGFIPGPYTVGGREGFISLWGFVWLKLVSGRSQDDADIIALAKQRMAEIKALRGKLPGELHERYDELLARAREEMENDPNLRSDIGAPDPGRVREMAAKYGQKKPDGGKRP